MNLSEFINLIKKNRKPFLIASALIFPIMLFLTFILNSIPYEITATIRMDSSPLLSAGTPQNIEKTYNKVVLSSDKLSDRDAMEYVQNNKEFYNNQGMVDYTELVSRLADKGFVNKTINSVEFYNYLTEKGVLSGNVNLSLVEQTDTMSLRISGSNKAAVESAYKEILNHIRSYVNDAIKKTLSQVTNALEVSISSDKAQMDSVIAEYEQLKATTKFEKTSDYNNALELLNVLSGLSHNTNQNMLTLNRINQLAKNELPPDVAIKSQSLKGLNLLSTALPYILIEIIASLLLALLLIFLRQALKNAAIDKKS